MKLFIFLLITTWILISCKSSEAKHSAAGSSIEYHLDTLITPFIDSAKAAGMVVAAFRGNEKILLKSYGYADLEYKINLPLDASFEIGSVTKQFTAVAILQQVDSGRIKLDDDITRYIRFNTQGHTVTVRQLLSHTSGIKGYTELPLFGKMSMHKYDRDTLLREVEKEKFDFEPGDALIYNNTGFFMLGLMIEKVTGIKYEEYVQKNLFDRAGMSHSYYCSESKIVPHRAHGYDTGEHGLQLAGYLDQLWPYAAGSLCCTAEDLIKWNQALHHGKLLSERMYKEFLSPTILNDGSVTHYAKGITVTDDHGQTMIEHGGGINGFLSENRYYPKEDLSIVVLINSTGPVSPRDIANNLTDAILGSNPKDSTVFTGDLNKYIGVYSGRGRGEDIKATVAKKDSTLTIQTDDKTSSLYHVKDNTWSDGNTSYIFKENETGVFELRMDQTYGYYIMKKN